MAVFPTNFTGQDRLQPGGRGEIFQQDMPGYRGQGDRINRTNTTLNTSPHDVTNIAYALDSRLPRLFRYGWAYGFNQIVITKGKIVAIDPQRSVIDFEDKKPHNVLTIANGGKDVDLNGTTWQAAAAAFEADTNTGLDKNAPQTRRPANKPIGIIMRNEYTRNDDAFNGIAPGAVLTDAMTELPWFLEKDKALGNPWGSAYGDLKPGDLMKSDENGYFVKSPLSNPDDPANAAIFADIKLYEKERQQLIGEIYQTFPELVPMGAAIYAQWALSDRLNFNEFNPRVWRDNNRDGEDSIPNSPYNSTGEYPGYPYEKGYMYDDLHMISQRDQGGRGGVYDPRLQLEYQMRNGIPGLTDGHNAYQNYVPNTVLGTIAGGATATAPIAFKKGFSYLFRTLEVNVEKTVVGGSVIPDQTTFDATAQSIIGDMFDATGAKTTDATAAVFGIDYLDNLQGLIRITVLKDTNITAPITFLCSYTKRGLSGVPTNLDWDGCHGTVKILLQK